MHKLKSILLIIFVILIFQGNVEPSLAEEDKGEGEYMMVAYDKAEWHYEGDFPEGLYEDQGFVHTGMYLGWVIENRLYSKEFKQVSSNEITKFNQGLLSGTELYMNWDGVLASDMLSKEGNDFTKDYYESGIYFEDYADLFPGVSSVYEVNDTLDNYNIVKNKVNERFKQWKSE
ncbi:hypothetical protein ACQJ0K_23200 [Priestia megaterium]|uniref:DUF7832 domain-containing protein n=1 Tax=Priestia megaterium TaxID=1404 RepID=UPI003CF05F4F